jgi:hypothetical protein
MYLVRKQFIFTNLFSMFKLNELICLAGQAFLHLGKSLRRSKIAFNIY